jgi:hypothetical protein
MIGAAIAVTFWSLAALAALVAVCLDVRRWWQFRAARRYVRRLECTPGSALYRRDRAPR